MDVKRSPVRVWRFRYAPGVPLVRAILQFSADVGYEDAAPTQTWWFSTTSLGTAAEEITTDWWGRINTFLGPRCGHLNQAGHTIRFYDMADPEPRRPFFTETPSFTAVPSTSCLPTQVSLCLSYQGAAVSGTSQARRRGRTYFGPFADDQDDGDGRPIAGLVTAMQTMGAGFLSDSETSTNYQWVVYSRASAAPVPVTNGWVDDAWDIQRRRQLPATSRTIFSLPG